MSSGKWRPFCPGLNVLMYAYCTTKFAISHLPCWWPVKWNMAIVISCTDHKELTFFAENILLCISYSFQPEKKQLKSFLMEDISHNQWWGYWRPGNMGSPGGCFTNVLQALQHIISKFMYCRNHTYENFKLKLCMYSQSHALGMRTKFQLEMWFPVLCIFARLFWRAHKMLLKQPLSINSHGFDLVWPEYSSLINQRVNFVAFDFIQH